MERRARKLLAQKLRVLRLMRKWSQEDLAAASGLHRTYISLLERAACNVSLDNIERLAKAFNLTVSELLDATDPAQLGKRVLAALNESTKRKES
jgi:transcriptional regulator with XRE-family HTH domain